jgi:hypothetical protein
LVGNRTEEDENDGRMRLEYKYPSVSTDTYRMNAGGIIGRRTEDDRE